LITHADVVAGVGRLSVLYVCACVCVFVYVSTLKQKSLDVSSLVLVAYNHKDISRVDKLCDLVFQLVLDWFVQVCFALKYIHGLHIVHRGIQLRQIKPRSLVRCYYDTVRLWYEYDASLRRGTLP